MTYINLGEEKFVQGAGRILAAGYVLTIDYGGTAEELYRTPLLTPSRERALLEPPQSAVTINSRIVV